MKMTILTEIVVASLVFTSSYSQSDTWIGQPPKLIKGPPKILIYRSGENVTLECKAKGVPAVTYEWMKDRKKLTDKLENIQRGVDGTITVQNATYIDEGFYQCSARNQYGTALSNTTHLQMTFLEYASERPCFVNKTVCAEKPFYIRCDEHRSFPKPTYFWEILNDTDDDNSIPFTPTKMTRIADNGDLHFGYALVNDSLDGKLYRCSANNSHLGVQKGRNYTRLTVTSLSDCLANKSKIAESIWYGSRGSWTSVEPTPGPTAEARHPPFDDHGFATHPIVGLTGGSVTMQCLFYTKKDDHLQISWSKYSPPGSLLPTGRYTLDAFNTTLTINNIIASDDGIYQCQAAHGRGITVRVEAAPMFPTVNDAPHDVNVSEGGSHTFSCNPVAKPEAKIFWLRDGKELDPNDPPKRFTFSNGNRSLTIEYVFQYCEDRDDQTDLMVIQCNASNVHGYAFAQGYLNVYGNNAIQNDTKICNTEIDEDTIYWSRTQVGKEIFRRCPRNKIGLCSRKCLPNADWSTTNYNGCFDKEYSELLDKINDLTEDDLKNQTVMDKQSVIDEIASHLLAMTNTSEGLSAGNLNASLMMMNRLAVLRSNGTDQPSEMEIKSIVQASSNVLRSSSEKAWKELENVDKNIAAPLLSTLDVYGRSLSMLNPSNHRIEEDSLVLETWSIEESGLPRQLEFPTYSSPSEGRISIYVESQNSSPSPTGTPSESQPALNMTLWGVHYSTIDQYLPGKKDSDDVINSKVLSFSIGGLNTNETLKRPVLITLKHNKEKKRLFRTTCAFWNFDRSDWDSAGCSVTSTNKTHTICSCDHLTNFAILMSRNPVKDELLSLISIIGCSISVASLILTAIVYAVTWKHAISSQTALLLNLCVALIIAYIIFMAGADKFDSNLYSTVGCKVVAVLLHYFLLVAFFIMLAEGIDMVLYIFFVFHVRRTRETIMLVAAAWVAPMIIVGVSLGVTRLEGYGHKEACWLSIDNGLIWAFIGPVLCIIAINLVILIIILRLISQKKALLATTSKTRDEIRATIWNLSVMCPVLGLGWLFGVFSLIFDHVAFQYLFVIANSLHGLLIFIIYALFHNKKMNEKISAVYYKYIGLCRKTDPSLSTKLTSSQEQSTSSTANTQMTLAQEHSRNSPSNTHRTLAQEQSASGATPAYVVLATTRMTSAAEEPSISPKPAYDSSLPHIQVISEPEPQSPSAKVVYRTVCWETNQILTEEQLLNIDDKFASTYESGRDTIYSQQLDESDCDSKET